MPKVVTFSRLRERKVPRRRWKPPRTRAPWRWVRDYYGFIAFGLLGAAALAIAFGPTAVGCDIKGNISLKTGERIYHVHGQEYYDATRINPFRGERWFCSEEAARKAGWRKALL